MRPTLPVVVAVLTLAACSSHQATPKPAPQGSEAGSLLVHIPAEVRPIEDAPKKVSPKGTTLVTLLAQGHNAFVGKLELAPNASVPEHQDPTEEYIHVLSGSAQMTLDGKQYAVAAGTTIYMPAYATVSVQNGAEPLVALQVFSGPAPAEKYKAWPDAK
jgi:quercetin dioxygenase-like cupin family protein